MLLLETFWTYLWLVKLNKVLSVYVRTELMTNIDA